jgi:UDP-2,3-diacylglucosamine hydrolase
VRCSFISDLHLDSATPRRNEAFQRFLRAESARCDELYILGDLTEAWVGDDDDSLFADLLRTELKNAATSCRIHLMHGNRDFLIGEVFARACAINLIADPCVIERSGHRILLCHGDSFCTDDLAYQQTRAVLRSRNWQSDVLAKSLPDRRALANSLRAQSRATNANKAANIMDVAADAVGHAQQLHCVDAIVHGHTHRPGIHTIGDDSRRRGVRYVLGDWDRCGWVLRLENDFTLLRFPLAGPCEI